MTVFTEAEHPAEFILSEANGQRSRENGTLVSGQDLAAGSLLKDNGSGKLTEATAELDSDNNLVNPLLGILIYNVDASAGDVAVSYLARDAEVNGNYLTYPSDSDTQQTAFEEGLASLGIIVRD